MNRGLGSNFLLSEKYKPFEIYRRIFDLFVEKLLTYGIN